MDPHPNPHPNRQVPQCGGCAIAVPGLLSAPCGCSWTLCPECFREEDVSFGAKCTDCGRTRQSFSAWVKTQPWLELKSHADREHEHEQASSVAIQQQMVANHQQTLLMKQPDPRPFPPLQVAEVLGLPQRTERMIRDATEGYAKAEALALLLRKLRLRDAAAKVLIVPPARKVMRVLYGSPPPRDSHPWRPLIHSSCGVLPTDTASHGNPGRMAVNGNVPPTS